MLLIHEVTHNQCRGTVLHPKCGWKTSKYLACSAVSTLREVLWQDRRHFLGHLALKNTSCLNDKEIPVPFCHPLDPEDS